MMSQTQQLLTSASASTPNSASTSASTSTSALASSSKNSPTNSKTQQQSLETKQQSLETKQQIPPINRQRTRKKVRFNPTNEAAWETKRKGFELDDLNVQQRVDDIKSIFAPLLRPHSLRALKMLSHIYPLPTSQTKTMSVSMEDRKTKAAKADDAAVPTFLWDSKIIKVFRAEESRSFSRPEWCSLGFIRALDILRSQITAYACRLLQRCFFRWYKENYSPKTSRTTVS